MEINEVSFLQKRLSRKPSMMFLVDAMSDSNKDADSEFFLFLKRPIRRSIVRILSASPMSFSDLQGEFKIDSSHMSYHLETLGNLVCRSAR